MRSPPWSHTILATTSCLLCFKSLFGVCVYVCVAAQGFAALDKARRTLQRASELMETEEEEEEEEDGLFHAVPALRAPKDLSTVHVAARQLRASAASVLQLVAPTLAPAPLHARHPSHPSSSGRPRAPASGVTSPHEPTAELSGSQKLLKRKRSDEPEGIRAAVCQVRVTGEAGAKRARETAGAIGAALEAFFLPHKEAATTPSRPAAAPAALLPSLPPATACEALEHMAAPGLATDDLSVQAPLWDLPVLPMSLEDDSASQVPETNLLFPVADGWPVNVADVDMNLLGPHVLLAPVDRAYPWYLPTPAFSGAMPPRSPSAATAPMAVDAAASRLDLLASLPALGGDPPVSPITTVPSLTPPSLTPAAFATSSSALATYPTYALGDLSVFLGAGLQLSAPIPSGAPCDHEAPVTIDSQDMRHIAELESILKLSTPEPLMSASPFDLPPADLQFPAPFPTTLADPRQALVSEFADLFGPLPPHWFGITPGSLIFHFVVTLPTSPHGPAAAAALLQDRLRRLPPGQFAALLGDLRVDHAAFKVIPVPRLDLPTTVARLGADGLLLHDQLRRVNGRHGQALRAEYRVRQQVALVQAGLTHVQAHVLALPSYHHVAVDPFACQPVTPVFPSPPSPMARLQRRSSTVGDSDDGLLDAVEEEEEEEEEEETAEEEEEEELETSPDDGPGEAFLAWLRRICPDAPLSAPLSAPPATLTFAPLTAAQEAALDSGTHPSVVGLLALFVYDT